MHYDVRGRPGAVEARGPAGVDPLVDRGLPELVAGRRHCLVFVVLLGQVRGPVGVVLLADEIVVVGELFGGGAADVRGRRWWGQGRREGPPPLAAVLLAHGVDAVREGVADDVDAPVRAVAGGAVAADHVSTVRALVEDTQIYLLKIKRSIHYLSSSDILFYKYT